MTYENPEVPHEVNVSRENPFVETLRLLAGIGICVLLATALLYFFGGRLARLIPFSTERSWVGEQVIGIEVDDQLDGEPAAIEKYLRSLTDRLTASMALAPDIKLTVHYTKQDVPNAFATLGGHIVITSGLYRRMPTENALAMVLAHEIAHVKARDPIAAIGGGASVALVLTLLTGSADSLLPQISQLTLLGYSRHAETAADDAALKAVISRYGHAGGTAAVFEILSQYQTKIGVKVPSLLSTHPADSERVARLRAATAQWDATRQPLRPIAIPVSTVDESGAP